jgi:hypothetical protein
MACTLAGRRAVKSRAWAGLIAVALAAAVGSAALSGSVLRPPLAFQGSNWAIVEWVDWKDVDPRCRQLGSVTAPNMRIQGCTQGRMMILPNPCPLVGYSADIACHELAHVNGWRH